MHVNLNYVIKVTRHEKCVFQLDPVVPLHHLGFLLLAITAPRKVTQGEKKKKILYSALFGRIYKLNRPRNLVVLQINRLKLYEK